MDSPGVERNRLLALLDAETRARLESALEIEPLHPRQIVMRPDVPLRRGYFPLDGALSLIAFDASGSGVEVGSIGYEGLLGLPIILGTVTMPLQAIVQLPGSAASLPADVMRAEYERRDSFHQVVTGRSPRCFSRRARASPATGSTASSSAARDGCWRWTTDTAATRCR